MSADAAQEWASARLEKRLTDALGYLGCVRGELVRTQELLKRWPRCPDGCGCRLGTDDADAFECGCEGPCTMECQENGYARLPSYRDLAVQAERDRITTLFDGWIAFIMTEPNAHPPQAWVTAFANLIRPAMEGGNHGAGPAQSVE